MTYNYTNGDGDRIFSPVYADVWDLVLKGMRGADVKVYLALLMHTHQKDRTWYLSIEELADDAGVARSTAAAAKDRLIAAGLISQAYRLKGNDGKYRIVESLAPPGSRGHNVYKVNVRPPAATSENRTNATSENRTNATSENRTSTRSPFPGAPTPEKDSPLADASGDAETLVDETPEWETVPMFPVETPPVEETPVEAPPAPEPGRGPVPDDYPPEFEEWYSRYPRRAGKRDALKAWWKAVRRIPVEDLAARTDDYARWVRASDKESRFVPYPATWLNRDSFLDDLPAPETAASSAGSGNTLAAWGAPSARNVAPDPWGDATIIDHNEGDLRP